MYKRIGRCALALAAGVSTSAWADTLATLADSGVRATDTSLSVSFASDAEAGSISFTLYGDNTLDGDNFWIDVFSLKLDGQPLLSGTWDLGGGGIDRVLDNASGATIARTDVRSLSISAPVTFAAGPHTLTFAYASPTEFEGIARQGFQDLGDEGWGVSSLTVTTAVPEPAPAALLAAGLAALALKRRRG